MDEYISREFVLSCVDSFLSKTDMPIAAQYFYDCFRECEAADVQPAKSGHWYHNTAKYISELDAYFIQACCSCCNRYSDRIDAYTQIMSNEFCSHCGADMRGEEQ